MGAGLIYVSLLFQPRFRHRVDRFQRLLDSFVGPVGALWKRGLLLPGFLRSVVQHPEYEIAQSHQ